MCVCVWTCVSNTVTGTCQIVTLLIAIDSILFVSCLLVFFLHAALVSFARLSKHSSLLRIKVHMFTHISHDSWNVAIFFLLLFSFQLAFSFLFFQLDTCYHFKEKQPCLFFTFFFVLILPIFFSLQDHMYPRIWGRNRTLKPWMVGLHWLIIDWLGWLFSVWRVHWYHWINWRLKHSSLSISHTYMMLIIW